MTDVSRETSLPCKRAEDSSKPVKNREDRKTTQRTKKGMVITMLKMNYKKGLMIGNKDGVNVFVYGMVKDMLKNGLIEMCEAVEHYGIYAYVLIDNKLNQHIFKSNMEVLAYIEENF